jgi:hypothetical protein
MFVVKTYTNAMVNKRNTIETPMTTKAIKDLCGFDSCGTIDIKGWNVTPSLIGELSVTR